MPNLRPASRGFRGAGERSILVVYPVLALLLLTVFSLLTPPFYGADEMAHAERALEVSHGEWVATRGAEGSTTAEFPDEVQPEDKPLFTRPVTADRPSYGTSLDSGFLAAAMFSSYPQRAFVLRYPHWTQRPDGRFPLATVARVESMPWSGQAMFVNFQNTAVYPAPLYLPAALAFRIGETSRLGIVQTLFLSRMFNAICAVGLGWLALRLAGPERLLLFCFLLLPVLLSYEASCSQDALLAPLMAVVVSLLTRALREGRQFRGWELAVVAAVVALAICARPPYVWLLVVLALPTLEQTGRGLWRWLRPVSAMGTALLLVGCWRFLIRASYLSHSGIAEPVAQMIFVKAHPLYTLYVLVLRGFTNVPDLLVHGLVVLELNSAATTAVVLALELLTVVAVVLVCKKIVLRKTSSRVVLSLALLAVYATMLFAEYLIWNAPGSNQVSGVQSRYFFPFLPLLFLLGSRGKTRTAGFAVAGGDRQTRWLPTAAMATYFAEVVSTPFLLAHRYYDMNLFSALQGVTRVLMHRG